MACPKCGHKIDAKQFPLGLAFCPYCGEKIEKPGSQPFPFCPYCGSKLPGAVKFCPECGKGLVPDKATSPLLNPQEACLPDTEPVTESASALDMTEPEEVRAAPPQAIWPKFKIVCQRIYQPVEGLVTGRWRLKRLYRQWSVHDALPTEEIPAEESIREMARASAASRKGPSPQLLAMLVIACIIIFFVAIGIIIDLMA